MKRWVAALVTAIGLVGVAPAVASAYTATGHTILNGQNWPSVPVSIHNYCTGANGGTNSDSSGFFSFINLTANCQYHIQATICVGGTLYVGYTEWLQPANNVVRNISLVNQGSSC
jgi:hypothetical protein